MKVPNWQHHSNKEAKWTLKPQALRAAKKRVKLFKKKLMQQTLE
tara:strand:+ start:424 stop:555 length:132 start_codon:yes stop_codon:yes gene_type:complete